MNASAEGNAVATAERESAVDAARGEETRKSSFLAMVGKGKGKDLRLTVLITRNSSTRMDRRGIMGIVDMDLEAVEAHRLRLLRR